jgi:hypothetical protein
MTEDPLVGIPERKEATMPDEKPRRRRLATATAIGAAAIAGALLAIPTAGLAQESTTSTTAVEEEAPDTTTDTTVAEEPAAPSEDRQRGDHPDGECEERADDGETSADT